MATKKKKTAKPIKKAAKKKALKKKKAAPKKSAPAIITTGAFADSIVPVTYVLIKSNDVEMKRLYIGDTKIDLEVDQDPSDPNKFATRGSKKYMCINDDEGLKIVARADGKAGGNWSLEISRSGSPLSSNPIEESTDGNGHLDHNDFHN